MKKRDFLLPFVGKSAIFFGAVCSILFFGHASVEASFEKNQEDSVVEISLEGDSRYQSELYLEPEEYYPKASLVPQGQKEEVFSLDDTDQQESYIEFDYTKDISEDILKDISKDLYQDISGQKSSQIKNTEEISQEAPDYFNAGNISGQLKEYVVDALKSYQTEIDITAYNIPIEQAGDVYFQILNQSPELFYVLENVKMSVHGEYAGSYKPVYLGTPEEIDEAKTIFETTVAKIVLQIQDFEFDEEKALFVHDYLALECQYDYENFLNNTVPDLSHTAYGALVNQVAVCDGYSEAFAYIMKQVGINCKVIASEDMAHAWNMVQIDGDWYHVDITWDDPAWDVSGRVRHDNFLITDSEISSAEEPHYGWVSDVQANSTFFDMRFWREVESAIIYFDGHWYYSVYQDQKVELRRVSGLVFAFYETVYETEEIWGTSEGYYPASYMYLDKAAGHIYFNTTKEIKRIDVDGSITTVYQIGASSEELIYGFTVADEKLYFAIQNSPELHTWQQLYYYELPELKEGIIAGVTVDDLYTTYDGKTKTFEIKNLRPDDKVVYLGYEGEILAKQPLMVDVGRYSIIYVISRPGCKEYIGTATVVIEKAVPQYQSIEGMEIEIETGTMLTEVELPAGYEWQTYSEDPLTELASYSCYVRYVPEDTDNYQIVNFIPIRVTVVCTKHEYLLLKETDSTYSVQGERTYMCMKCGHTSIEKKELIKIKEEFLSSGVWEDVSGNSLSFSWKSAGDGLQYRVSAYRTNGKRDDTKVVESGFCELSNLYGWTEYRVEITPFEVLDGQESPVPQKITFTCTTGASKTEWKSIKKSGRNAAKLTWKRVGCSRGYEIYMKAGKGKFKKIKTIRKSTITTFKKNRLKPNITYRFKIRAYGMVKGKKIYGAYSKVKKFKIKI